MLFLAEAVTASFHGAEAARAAAERFDRLFRERAAPNEMPERKIAGGETVLDVIVAARLAPSKSEARRLVAQGGVHLDGAPVDDPAATARPGVLKVGKRRFLRLV